MKKKSVEALLFDAFAGGRFLQVGGVKPGNEVTLSELERLLNNLAQEGYLSTKQNVAEVLSEYAPDITIAPAQANRLYFLDLLFEQVQSQLDDAIQALFFSLRPMLCHIILHHDDFIKSSQYVLRSALDNLLSHSLGWQTSLGRGGEKLFVQIEVLVEALRDFSPARTQLPASVLSAEEALLKSVHRFDLLESRMCESEQGAMDSLRSRRFVDNYLNDALAGKSLHRDVVGFLHSEWRNSLQIHLQTHGKESQQWQKQTQLTEQFVHTFLPCQTEQEKQALYKVIPGMPATLKKHLVSLHDEKDKEHALRCIEDLHMQILKGSRLEVEPVVELSLLSTEGVATNMSTALSAEAACLQPGQWVLYRREDGDEERMKLAMLASETAQMLFVNVLGAKCLEKNIEEFAYAMASKKAILLESKKPFSKLIVKAVEKIIREHHAQKNSIQKANDIKQRSIQKAKQEVGRISSESPRSIDPPIPVSDELPESKREQIIKDIAALEMGAWVSMDNRLGERVPCKIAVIFSSTGKMVFVDKSGLKVGDFRRHELLEKIMQGEATILEGGDKFENSLAKVIQSLRRD